MRVQKSRGLRRSVAVPITPAAPNEAARPAIRWSLALASVGLLAGSWLVRPWARPPSSEGAVEWAGNRLAELDAAPDEPYTRDRARRILGTLVDEHQRGVEAEILLFDSRDLARDLAAAAEQGLDALLGFTAHPERISESDQRGLFDLRSVSTGNKALFHFAPGFAPARRGDVLVRDGAASWRAGATLLSARHGEVVNDIDTLEVQQIYGAWWPGTEWESLPADGRLRIEFRMPDGWPRWLAVRGKAGAIRLLELPEQESSPGDQQQDGNAANDEGARSWRISELRDWQPHGDQDLGEAALPSEMGQALARASRAHLGLGTAAGRLLAAAGDRYARVEIEMQHGGRRQVFADSWAQARFEGLPAGFHLVRATDTDGRWSRPVGVAVPEGGSALLERLAAAPPRAVQGGVTLRGFLCHPEQVGVPLRGVIFCQTPSGRGFFHRLEADEQGFFEFSPLAPGAVYDLIYASAEAANHVRHVRRVQMPAERGSSETLHLLLPLGTLRVRLGESVLPGDDLRVRAVPDPPENDWLIWRMPLEGQHEFVLRNLPSGTMRIEHWREGILIAVSPTALVGSDATEVTLDVVAGSTAAVAPLDTRPRPHPE